MNFDPTKRVPVMPSLPKRDVCVIQIIYDPNTSIVQVQSAGFRDNVEELGAFVWAQAMREKLFCDAAQIGDKRVVAVGAGAMPPNGRAQ